MKLANLVEDGQIIVQVEYEVSGSGGKNYSISGKAFLPHGWDMEGGVTDRDFLVSFSSNWECDTVLRFLGEDYEKEGYSEELETLAYYQTGSVYGLINISRSMFMIQHLLEMELKKTDTYMYQEDNEYAKSFDMLRDCLIEVEEI